MHEKKPRVDFEGYVERSEPVDTGQWQFYVLKVGDHEMTTFDDGLMIAAARFSTGAYVRGQYYVNSKGKLTLDSVEGLEPPMGAKTPAGQTVSPVPGVTPYQVVQQRGYLHKDAMYAATRLMDIRVQALTLRLEVLRNSTGVDSDTEKVVMSSLAERLEGILDASTSAGFLALAGKLQKALEADVFRDMAERPAQTQPVEQKPETKPEPEPQSYESQQPRRPVRQPGEESQQTEFPSGDPDEYDPDGNRMPF